eukprot:scaffold340550_cov53-Prasinocladus_malaysianus.AAC.1
MALPVSNRAPRAIQRQVGYIRIFHNLWTCLWSMRGWITLLKNNACEMLCACREYALFSVIAMFPARFLLNTPWSHFSPPQ